MSASCSFCAKQYSGGRKVREELAFSIDLTRRWLPVVHVLFKWRKHDVIIRKMKMTSLVTVNMP